MSLAKTIVVAVALLSSYPAAANQPLFQTDDFRGNIPGVTLRGVNAGGQPWVFDQIQATLFSPDEGETLGRLRVKVKGLVFAPGTPLAGTRGGVEFYAATLSCQIGRDADANGVVIPANRVNVTTDGFPTNLDGDADIDAVIEVPAVCWAPVLFVRSFSPATGAGNWFAVTGF